MFCMCIWEGKGNKLFIEAFFFINLTICFWFNCLCVKWFPRWFLIHPSNHNSIKTIHAQSPKNTEFLNGNNVNEILKLPFKTCVCAFLVLYMGLYGIRFYSCLYIKMQLWSGLFFTFFTTYYQWCLSMSWFVYVKWNEVTICFEIFFSFFM